MKEENEWAERKEGSRQGGNRPEARIDNSDLAADRWHITHFSTTAHHTKREGKKKKKIETFLFLSVSRRTITIWARRIFLITNKCFGEHKSYAPKSNRIRRTNSTTYTHVRIFVNFWRVSTRTTYLEAFKPLFDFLLVVSGVFLEELHVFGCQICGGMIFAFPSRALAPSPAGSPGASAPTGGRHLLVLVVVVEVAEVIPG